MLPVLPTTGIASIPDQRRVNDRIAIRNPTRSRSGLAAQSRIGVRLLQFKLNLIFTLTTEAAGLPSSRAGSNCQFLTPRSAARSSRRSPELPATSTAVTDARASRDTAQHHLALHALGPGVARVGRLRCGDGLCGPVFTVNDGGDNGRCWVHRPLFRATALLPTGGPGRGSPNGPYHRPDLGDRARRSRTDPARPRLPHPAARRLWNLTAASGADGAGVGYPGSGVLRRRIGQRIRAVLGRRGGDPRGLRGRRAVYRVIGGAGVTVRAM